MKVKLCVALLALMLVMLPLSLLASSGAAPANTTLTATQISANLPLSFEPAIVAGRYLAHSGRYAVSIGATESSVVVTDPKSKSSRGLRFVLENANAAASIEALEPLPSVTNYYVGADPQKWRLGVKNFARLRAKSIYPGVDIVYYGDQRRLEFDFVVAPQADPSAIALNFSGMDKLYTGTEGDLVAELGGQPVRFAKPFAYQTIAGERKPVSVQYVLAANGKAQLHLGDYDKNLELVIDPVVTYATYLGGHQSDEVDGLAVDANGNAYVTGETCSPDFPGVASTPTNCNAFVSEIKADGSALVGNTVVIGGSNNTWGRAIVLDSAGTAYIVGGTNSLDLPVPATATVFKYDGTSHKSAYFGGDSDAFIAVVSGGTLLRVAYLGGNGADDGYGVAIDSASTPNVIATGETCYQTGLDAQPDFPAYSGFEKKVELCVGFITKLDNGLNLYVQDPVNASYGDGPAITTPNGVTFYFSEYFGGQPPTVPSSGWIASHHFYKGDIISVTYVSNFIVQSSAYKCTRSGTTGAFEPAADWSPTVGSVVTDGGVTWQNMGTPGVLVNASTISHAVATDPLGDIFVAGGSDSGFIGCSLCGDTSYFVGSGAWVAKVSKDGGWRYSTVLGTTATDTANAIAVDGSGRAYIVGTSTGGIFIPANTISFQSKNGGGQDAFILQLDNAGTTINYASYLGGSADDQGNAVAVDVNGAAYVVGSTKSPDFPTVNPLTNTKTNLPMNTVSGPQDAFVTRVIPGGSALGFSSYIGGTNADQGFAVAASQDGAFVMLGGSTHSLDFPVYQGNSNAPAELQPIYNKGVTNDAGDAFIVRLPIATLPNVAISPSELDFGAVAVPSTSPAQAVTFTNTGNSPITITAVTITGEFAPDPASNCVNAQLTTDQTCTEKLTFTPTTYGARPDGTVKFYDNGTGSPQILTLTGTGLKTGGGSLTLNATTFTFADQPQNTTSTAKVFTATNIGDAAVTFTSIAITPSPSDFALTTDPSNPANSCSTSTPLASALSCTIAVTFTPSAVGASTGATLTLTGSSNTVTVTLGGKGTAALAPGLTITPPPTTPAITVGVGKSTTFSVTLTGTGGFNQKVTMSCAIPSTSATCSVAFTDGTSSVLMDGTSTPKSATVTLTIPAASSGGSGGTRTGSIHWGTPFGALPFCAALTLLGGRRRRWMVLLLVALGLVLILSGCGGGSSSSSSGGSSGMAAGPYTVNVTATVGGVAQTPVTVPVTVTP